ncbi:NADH-quinone oxidoreductase subunit NuoF [Clostridium ganghwense]|uniref:NADH-quinone oxidoreductase subunit NuoF n=1 Tax=Clostridium ganghwense TaxID=312089 RepID=A0ABT4CQX4_9CLOT|nr:NADH-quinone oxidoreductase subunit NuoF [Clostridium ganghwense]MCY6371452.1 NADH-quinone oxidoreductase subunit NuoF [Clostridium ganghwense]
MEFYNSQVLICGGEGCKLLDSKKIINLFKLELKQYGLDKEVEIIKVACLGFCNLGPVMVIYPEGTIYANVKPADVHEIVEEHFINGRAVKRLVYALKPGDGRIRNLNDINMFKKQERIVLRNCGIINPENIDEYIAMDGYKALGKVLTKMSPQDVIDVISKSGLRGRGGGGFPTGKKWSFAAAQNNDEKYIICNADEGDPGAFMDRSVLEGDPHSILEAMIIGGYAIGANKGFIYVRAEYPLAVERLKIAIDQAKEYGLLGDNILGTGFKFDIEIRLGAGAFVCGEETALIQSIEGKRGMPITKPPFPAVSGLWGKPTIINNVETFANICPIILKGAKWFRSIGTEKSPGTKVFALGGKIRNTGLVEIPMGTTLREVIFNIGGGIPNNKQFKAVQTGGPSGGCIPARYINIPIEYDTLIELGSMMGSGGMIVMDEDNCMVDVARFFLDFTKDESCGKCTSCRIGTKRLLEILEKITRGEGSLEDVEKLEKLAVDIKNTALCGLGQTAPNPILSTLRYFKDEYISHVVDNKCPAKACKPLVKYRIKSDVCKRCGMCAKNCSAGAITSKVGEPYEIDQSKCIKCGSCMQVCLFNAIVKE